MSGVNIFRKNELSNNEILGIHQKIYDTPSVIKLSKAVLCLDCETIFARKENKIGTANNYCPSCGGKTTYFISKFLNRVENK